MVFPYYNRLSASNKRVYRRSDEILEILLADAAPLQPPARELEAALAREDRRAVQALCQQLADGITGQLAIPGLAVEVLAVRPSDDSGELHGLYTGREERKRARIQLWMRTAKHKRVVAYRSFLRTLLHEVCHHVDFEKFALPDSFHTAGFYKRESSLFRQLVPGPGQAAFSRCRAGNRSR